MRRIFLLLWVSLVPLILFSQVRELVIDKPENSFTVIGIAFNDRSDIMLQYGIPLFSMWMDENFYNSYCASATFQDDGIHFILADSIEGFASLDKSFKPGLKYTVRFTNKGKGDHRIENLVPMGEGTDKVFITAEGTKEWPQYLCRSVMYRPGYGPVGVILPDNAWHLGFADFRVNDTLSLTGLARRSQRNKELTEIDRWSTLLKPDGWIEYSIWFDIHAGDWHEGLKMMFHDRYLYDLHDFDNSLFERKDLQWMRDRYIMLLQFAWDKKYYDYLQQKYTFYDSFSEYDSLTGGYDIFTLWPTWPRLGLDQRNQWDMYRDLPGGLEELKKQSEYLHRMGKHYFISYNPWDEGTRREEQLKGMEKLLRYTDADGVVLDTRGASSKELQAAADRVRPGIIMYSEGMAVPKDMPGIVSGRVHDALVLPPPLNLNKLIKPDFAIFRVLQLADDRLHRELAISFFNGYGVEINTARPGRPSWIKEDYAYMGRTTRILRENNSVFHNDDWMPLLPVLTDSIYVNRWISAGKVLYTIYSVNPRGNRGPLFEAEAQVVNNVFGKKDNVHYVDLWNHREIVLAEKKGKTLVPAEIGSFDPSFLGTRLEGSTGCIAVFPERLRASVHGDSLYFSSTSGDRISVCGEDPSYASKILAFPAGDGKIRYRDHFPVDAEKIVIQLFSGNELTDERVIFLANNLPVLISGVIPTEKASTAPAGMAEIREGNFRFYTSRAPGTQEPFIALPDHSDTVTIHMDRFYMDIYPVTNRQFREFLEATEYIPKDPGNFLKHWSRGRIPKGEEDYPVVYVSPEDAKAYADWAGKRLPTEAEWQYAAQGSDMRKYPWGGTMDSTKCNYNLGHETDVNAFPRGASPFGIQDMTGNVWQLTNDVYDIGCYYYTIIRGGSYYYPTESIWYVTGGPVPADHPEILLLVSPSLNRNATVGFRCVKDGF